MSKIVTLPKIGVNMTEAVIAKWRVKVGDVLAVGDIIVDAETDKASQEITTTVAGTVAKLLVEEGAVVQCQDPIAILADAGEILQEETAPAANVTASGSDRIRISPLAKKMVREMGMDAAAIQPSHPGARITKKDVLVARANKASVIAIKPTAPKPMVQPVASPVAELSGGVDTVSYSGIRKVIGERMLESWQQKPRVALSARINATELIRWREKLKVEGRNVGYNELLAKIAAHALREYPMMNARLVEGRIEIPREINIGIAVDTPRGLVVPVLNRADTQSVVQLSTMLKEKADRAKEGKNTPDDMEGGTFTISNLGMYEIDEFVPVINPPECCILAVGSIVREPVADAEDRVVVQPRMTLTLAFDHRIVDGGPAARFLQRIKHLVEWPLGLL